MPCSFSGREFVIFFFQINTGISFDFFYALNLRKLIETSIIEYNFLEMHDEKLAHAATNFIYVI